MNILTKICVVVLLILVLVASVVFINMATVLPNYRELYEAKKTEAALAKQDARTQKLLTNRLTHEMELLADRNSGLSREVAKLKVDAEPDVESRRTAEIVQKLSDFEAKLEAQALTIKAMGDRNTLLEGQLKQERAQIAKLQEQYAAQTGKLTEVTGELQRSERVVRALEQQLRDREERIAELERQKTTPGAAAAEGAVTVAAQSRVNGTVSAVRGETASINVGAAQGVTRGQKYYIYRNATFVGYLRIDEVDEGEAAGTVVDKQLDPVIGDKVTNDLMK